MSRPLALRSRRVLATIEAAYGPPDGQAATARPIAYVWAR
jgi:hypothetical protein